MSYRRLENKRLEGLRKKPARPVAKRVQEAPVLPVMPISRFDTPVDERPWLEEQGEQREQEDDDDAVPADNIVVVAPPVRRRGVLVPRPGKLECAILVLVTLTWFCGVRLVAPAVHGWFAVFGLSAVTGTLLAVTGGAWAFRTYER